MYVMHAQELPKLMARFSVAMTECFKAHWPSESPRLVLSVPLPDKQLQCIVGCADLSPDFGLALHPFQGSKYRVGLVEQLARDASLIILGHMGHMNRTNPDTVWMQLKTEYKVYMTPEWLPMPEEEASAFCYRMSVVVLQ